MKILKNIIVKIKNEKSLEPASKKVKVFDERDLMAVDIETDQDDGDAVVNKIMMTKEEFLVFKKVKK